MHAIAGPAAAPQEIDKAFEEKKKPPKPKRENKARGPKKERKFNPTELVKPTAIGESRKNAKSQEGTPKLGGEGNGRWLEQTKLEAMMQRLSEGTREGYESGWKQWVLFRKVQKKPVMLEGASREERRDDEEDLMTFIIFLARVMGRTEATVKQRLFAVRYAHLVLGFSDPLAHKARMWAAVAGLKRWQGPMGPEAPGHTQKW